MEGRKSRNIMQSPHYVRWCQALLHFILFNALPLSYTDSHPHKSMGLSWQCGICRLNGPALDLLALSPWRWCPWWSLWCPRSSGSKNPLPLVVAELIVLCFSQTAKYLWYQIFWQSWSSFWIWKISANTALFTKQMLQDIFKHSS